MSERPAEIERTLFSKDFGVTHDDLNVLRFFEQRASGLINSLIIKGYSKNAIADGLIHAINQWRNKPS